MRTRKRVRQRGGASYPCICGEPTRVFATRRRGHKAKTIVVRLRGCPACGRQFYTHEQMVPPKLTPEARIFWLGKKKNPFRAGSGAWSRTEHVRERSGDTFKAMKDNGIRRRTINTLLRRGLVAL